MSEQLRRCLFILGLLLLPLTIGGTVLVEAPPECPPGSGCIQVVLYPEMASGDLYIDGMLMAQAQNPGWLVVAPDIDHLIEIKNIQSSEAGFGTLFSYADLSSTLKVRAGETRSKPIWLTKHYIRGTLKFTCDIRSAAPSDAVACRVTIDEIVQPDVAASQTVPYILDPGNRDMRVEVVGEQADLFDPAFKEQGVKITAGRIATWQASFNKKGHLYLSLDQPGVVADFFIDGVQVATQTASIDRWVTSRISHRIEVKNLTDPASAGIYTWKDVQQYVVVWPNMDKTIIFKLRKQYLVGFLSLKCNIDNVPGAYCVPTLDTVEQPAIAAGASTQYTLAPGSHNIIVSPGPPGSWRPASITRKVTTRAGITQTITLSFRPAPQSSAAPSDESRLPILTMGGCNPENRGYLWGPVNLATRAGFESKNLMTTIWAPPECRPDASDHTHPPRSLTVAECAIFYYKPRTLVLFPNRPFDGTAYYDNVAALIRHIESYENEIGLSHSRKVLMGPISYEGGVIGSPNTVTALGVGVIDLPDIIHKTWAATGFVAATDNVHLIPSPYFFSVVDIVVRKAIGGAGGIYTIESSEIPPYTP
ncbi:MAG: hypothetical protein JXB07_11280 [Anaerolineae bacterium]|nr:hypothetical protein [Anaerolineae bacterium]